MTTVFARRLWYQIYQKEDEIKTEIHTKEHEMAAPDLQNEVDQIPSCLQDHHLFTDYKDMKLC